MKNIKNYNDWSVVENKSVTNNAFKTTLNAGEIILSNDPFNDKSFSELSKYSSTDNIEFEMLSANLDIYWKLNIETKEWGVSNIEAVFNNIKGVMSFTITDTITNDEIETIDIDVNFDFSNYDIYSDLDVSNDMLVPKLLMIDFKNKKITIS